MARSIKPSELSQLALSLQQQGVLNLDVPVKTLLQLKGLSAIESTLTADPDTGEDARWYVVGGSGYVAVCS